MTIRWDGTSEQLAWCWHTASSQVTWAVIAVYRKSNGLLRGCLCLLLDHWVFFSGKAGSETYFCSDIGQLFAAVRTASFSHWLMGGSFPSSLLIVFLFFYRYQKVSLHIKNILFTSLIYWVALSDWRVADDPAFCSYARHNFPWAVSKPLLLFIPQPPPPLAQFIHCESNPLMTFCYWAQSLRF